MLAVAATALLLAGNAGAAPATPADVLAAEAGIARAQMAKDVAAFEKLLAEGHTFTLPDGKIVPRAQQLNDLATWWSPTLVEFSSQSVRLSGDTAIVNGRARYRWQSKDKPPEEAIEQYTDTYVHRSGRWQRLASHSSCISGRCT